MSRATVAMCAVMAASCGARSELIVPDVETAVPDATAVDVQSVPDIVVATDQGPCFEADLTPWQFHDTSGPMCVPQTFTTHGEPGEFGFAMIPPATDPGWTNYPSATIDFMRDSRLCGTACTCFDGVDFDYWQTFLSVPTGLVVTSLTFTISNVDDGAHITIFNDRFPNGTSDPGSFVQLFGSTTSNLASYIVPGQNRIVLTHVDDCCSGSFVMGASITLDGTTVRTCR